MCALHGGRHRVVACGHKRFRHTADKRFRHTRDAPYWFNQELSRRAYRARVRVGAGIIEMAALLAALLAAIARPPAPPPAPGAGVHAAKPWPLDRSSSVDLVLTNGN